MNAETFEQLRKAAGLACLLRNALEDIQLPEGADVDDWELECAFEDLACDAGQIEAALDSLVESYS